MPFWNRAISPASAEATDPSVPRRWQRVLVPTLERPYSARALDVAFRLARQTSATVHLAYIIEVPRAYALQDPLPDLDEPAAEALRDAQALAKPYPITIQPFVHRTRKARDGILALIEQENIDLLVLGARPDELRGLPRDLARELFESARCEVVVDYMAGEK